MDSRVKLPGAELASNLRAIGEEAAQRTPMDLVLEAAQAGNLNEDGSFKLLGRLWVLKRLMYYVYGGWAQGLNVNEYPPSVDYLLSKQLYDDSTHEMLYIDEILARKWARTQRKAFEHAHCQFVPASRIGHFIFTIRALANYSHNIRIAAFNLGAKVIELGWLQRFGEEFPDPRLRALFAGQIQETESHIQMGRFIVERFVESDVDQELCRRTAQVARRDYGAVLDEIGACALGIEAAAPAGTAEVPRGLD